MTPSAIPTTGMSKSLAEALWLPNRKLLNTSSSRLRSLTTRISNSFREALRSSVALVRDCVLHFERFRQIIRRRRYPALAMRNAGDLQTHLDAAQSSSQHQIVEVTEMPDAENLILQLAEAGAER